MTALVVLVGVIGGGGVIRQEGEIRELISPLVDNRVAGLLQWNI